MPHLMTRVEVADFDTWLRTHLENSRNREAFGIVADRFTGTSITQTRFSYTRLSKTWIGLPSGFRRTRSEKPAGALQP